MAKKKHGVVGRTIVFVTKMALGGWFRKAPTLVLDNGAKLFPAADPEMNDAGALFGELPPNLTPAGQMPGFYVLGGPESGFLRGTKIRAVRNMTRHELEEQGWESEEPGVVIELEDGIKLFPSHDEEGNRPGVMVGMYAGKEFYLEPEGPKEWSPGK